MRKFILCFVFSSGFFGYSSQAQTTWNAFEGAWDDPLNWMPAVVPDSATDVVIRTGDTFIVTVDTGNAATTVKSITFNPQYNPFGGVGFTVVSRPEANLIDQLFVTGNIANTSEKEALFYLPVHSAGNVTYDGGTAYFGGLSFNAGLNIHDYVVNILGTVALASTLTIDVTSSTTHGFVGSLETFFLSQINLNFQFDTTTLMEGAAFDFTSGAFTDATLVSTLPDLSPGLFWDTSLLFTNGTLSVIPEPSTYAFFVCGLVGILTLKRKKVRERMTRKLVVS